ncbi:hypothetical protein A2Z67_06250 [Candidatus Woesebacteria bacterium RBG_13_36_22]|uniref:Uncharacterized protein n=1 Tax=Candidatus Woesebacteria bacterium RBG_13_36_22 TaxID=1802478 RepID=A0A1F7X1D7_9BACT|nr:MAG: hypothetical protein A2Z67_06250 [Candidatus Woesebacteria bacterium RBG_13_36_22]
MKELSLDEYRLLMGTQLWLKESFFNFLEVIIGGSSSTPKASVSQLDKELSKVTGELSKKTGTNIRKDFNKEFGKLNDKLQESSENKTSKNMQTYKQKSEVSQDNSPVDLSNWSLLVNDNSSRRDAKVDSLNDKLRNLKKRGYIK